MKIKIYIHAMDLPGGHEILLNQVELMEKTELIDSADEINVMCHFDIDNFTWLRERWSDRKNVYSHHFDNTYKEWYEATTIHHIQEQVHQTDEEYYVLYISPKGISHAPGGHQNWRKYMEYWNVEKWKECVAKLDEGYDTCGASFLNNPPHPYYAGNFFWAKASYLRKCRRLMTPEENDYKPQFEQQPHHRFDLECWHGSGNPKWFDLHPGEDNRWYSPPEAYREDLSNVWTYRT